MILCLAACALRVCVFFVWEMQAADADSIVSAITLGFFYHLKQDASNPVLVVPVACIPAEDIELRRDVAVLLQKAGMDIR
jgi:hypothetical protein